ncbi:hypothetical protein U1Q18_038701 [Sarracenia purpurea var. burkii]
MQTTSKKKSRLKSQTLMPKKSKRDGDRDCAEGVDVHSGCDEIEHNVHDSAGRRDDGAEDRRERDGEVQGVQELGTSHCEDGAPEPV